MIKGSETQKQRPHELLWMLWFDEKSISNVEVWYITLFLKDGEKDIVYYVLREYTPQSHVKDNSVLNSFSQEEKNLWYV